jgi:hypothetical protein
MTETLLFSVSPDFESVQFVTGSQVFGERLQVAPEDYYASLQTARPPSESMGFQRLISPRGTFKFTIPAVRSLVTEDWTLYIHGYPRIADRINYEALDGLMGEEAVLSLQALATRVHEGRESVGDIFSKERARGPVAMDELDMVLAKNTRRSINVPDLNQRTSGRRAFLLATSPYIPLEGKYVVPRSLLIADEPNATASS